MMLSGVMSLSRSRSPKAPRRDAGFTYVELMITLAIMGVLALVAVPSEQLVRTRANEHELRADLIEVREAIDAYKRAADQGRIQLQVGESGYPKKLADLVDGVKDQQSVEGKMLYFLRRVPRDPMDPDVMDDPAESWGKRSYKSAPGDPQEGDDVYDVYSRSPKIGLNGVPYRQW